MADSNRGDTPDDIDWAAARLQFRRLIPVRLGRCSEADLEDLVSEAVVKLYRTSREQPIINLSGLMVIIARRTVADEIRRRRRNRRHFVDLQIDQLIDQLSAPAMADPWMERLWFLMVEYFRSCKAPCLSLALLYQELGNWNPVAERVGKSGDAIRQQWSRCARQFAAAFARNREAFEDWLGDDG